MNIFLSAVHQMKSNRDSNCMTLLAFSRVFYFPALDSRLSIKWHWTCDCSFSPLRIKPWTVLLDGMDGPLDHTRSL
jgi:hypothetical protein